MDVAELLRVYWVSADRQSDQHMGSYDFLSDAELDLPVMRAQLREQCSGSEAFDRLYAGRFEIRQGRETLQDLAFSEAPHGATERR